MADKNEVSIVIKAKDLASSTFGTISKSAQSMVRNFFDVGTLVKGAVAGIAAISLTAIVKDMWDLGTAWDASMRKIGASLPTGTEGLSDLRQSIEREAKLSGRSLEEMRSAAAEIAHLGVESAHDVTVRLQAATEFADATGTDLSTTVKGLDQVMDLFNLSAADAQRMLANIWAKAKGKVDAESIFDAFSAGAAQIKAMGIEADTATRIIVRLLDEGKKSKAVRQAFTAYDAGDLRKMASEVTSTSDGLQQMRRDADLVRESFERTDAGIKAGFETTLGRLGTKLRALSHPALKWLADALDGIDGPPDPNSLSGKGFRARGLDLGYGQPEVVKPDPNRPDARQTAGEGGGPAKPGVGAPKFMTIEEKKAATEAAKKVRETYLELERLNAETANGTPKHILFGQAIDKWREQAQAAGLTATQVAAALQQLRVTQEQIRQQVIADILKQGSDAIAEFSTDLVTELDQQISSKVKSLSDGMQQLAPNSPERAQALAQIEAYLQRASELRVVLQGVVKDEQDVANVAEDLKDPLLSDAKLVDDLQHLADLYQEQYTKLQKLTPGTKDYAAAKGALAKTEETLGKAIDVVAEKQKADDDRAAQEKKNAEERRERILKLADAWMTYARAAIGALQALGKLDDKSAAMLQNVVNVGEGIAKIYSGKDVIGGTAETITSSAAILSSLFGDSPEHKAARALMEKNTEALARLRDELHSSGLNVTGTDLGTARGQLAALLGATRGSTDTMKTGLKELFATLGINSPLLHDVANALGIQIDDTLGSYRRLADAVEIASGSVLKFGTSYAEGTLSADAEAAIMGITDPIALLKLRARAGIAASPLIAGLFGGVGDLNDAGQRDALLKSVQALFAGIQAGTVSSEGLGGLKRDELLQLLEQLAGDLRNVQTGASAGTQATSAGYQALTTVQGDRLIDLTQQQLVALRSIASGVGRLAGFSVSMPTLPMPQLQVDTPRIPTIALTMRDINVAVTAPRNTGDPAAFGQAVARGTSAAIVRELDQALADRQVQAARRRGDITVRPS